MEKNVFEVNKKKNLYYKSLEANMSRSLGKKDDGDGQQFRQAESKTKCKIWR